ncbi:hypothetical protein [Shimia sediminis]|uniref:hypothetical protein n=1 Tax=Shimia sediminis TaxID=2497945 RepID=UPI000F8E47E2|nr:hypothetical protein [Shimia sediminis]
MSTPQPPYPESIEPEEISRLAELQFGEPVRGITAPGGKTRDSLRVHFENHSVIASYRHRASRREREVLVLETLHRAGAPVPELLGVQGALLFQSDVGKGRLSTQLHRRDRDGQISLAEAAFTSLWEIKRAARDTGLTEEVPAVASSAKWVSRFATDCRKLATALDIPAPAADYSAISRAIVPVPRHFVKWDARSGNAAVQADGRVMWFDWEHAGRRHGIEDFGFLIADEFWSLSPEDSLQAFSNTCPGNAEALLPHLIRFSTLQAGERLRLIQKEVFKRGWTRFERARRYDRMGAAPELAMNVAKHADELAAMDPLTVPLSGWYSQAAEALFEWWEKVGQFADTEDQPPEENAP